MRIASIQLAFLPAVGQPLDGGKFAGLTTTADGKHAAVVLLDDKPATPLNWQAAKDWADSQDGELPTRPVAAMLFANLKSELKEEWHWTADENSASYAWTCYFNNGGQLLNHKSAVLCARAVRLIPLVD